MAGSESDALQLLQELLDVAQRWSVAGLSTPTLPGEPTTRRDYILPPERRLAVQRELAHLLEQVGGAAADYDVDLDEEAGYEEVSALLNSGRQELLERLRAVPASPAKAQAYMTSAAINLETWLWTDCADIVLSLDEIPNSVGPAVLSAMRSEIQFRHEKREAPGGWVLDGDIFWTVDSPLDLVAPYLIGERLALPGLDSLWREVEAEARRMLVEGGQAEPRAAWAVSLSSHLTIAAGEAVTVALAHLVAGQEEAGSWTDHALSPPATSHVHAQTTAMAVIALARSGYLESHAAAAKRGAEWLILRQSDSGAWLSSFIDRECPYVTGLCCEAILRSGVPSADQVVDPAFSWLLDNQGDEGLWSMPLRRSEPIQTTARVMAAFDRYQRWPKPEPQGYLAAAQGFLRRALRLATEDSASSRRLAVAAAYHGAEAFLYALLQRPELEIDIWRKADQTIGFRQALGAFGGALRERNPWDKKGVSQRGELQELASIRDQVIHKASDVSVAECSRLVVATADFVSEWSNRIEGYDLLDP